MVIIAHFAIILFVGGALSSLSTAWVTLCLFTIIRPVLCLATHAILLLQRVWVTTLTLGPPVWVDVITLFVLQLPGTARTSYPVYLRRVSRTTLLPVVPFNIVWILCLCSLLIWACDALTIISGTLEVSNPLFSRSFI